MTKRAVIITSSVLVGVLVGITILLVGVFRVREISAGYAKDFCYKEQIDDILTASNLKKNTSIFNINRDKIAGNIEAEFPYVRVDGVNLDSFTSVKITLSNRNPLYYFSENEVYYIVDEDCKVLEKLTFQEYNARAYDLIELQSVFSAGDSVTAGKFLNGKYVNILSSLYRALYCNAMLEVDNGFGEFEPKYLEREDMCEVINSINFTQEYEMYGKVDKLVMSTTYGVKITIIEPEKNLDSKINKAFSALRALQQKEREFGDTSIHTGSINIIYSYDEVGNVSTMCEYRV